MKTVTIGFGVLAAIIIGVLVVMGGSGPQVETGEISGVVASVDLEQIAFDGPARIFLEDGGVILVPSMGLPLCAAVEDIADVFAISVGDRVSARGNVFDGVVGPCTETDHYLRVE